MIKKAWLDYFEAILMPAEITNKVQINETRKAFYAGAGCVFYGMLNSMKSTDYNKEPTEDEINIMAGLQKELDQFLKTPQAYRPESN